MTCWEKKLSQNEPLKINDSVECRQIKKGKQPSPLTLSKCYFKLLDHDLLYKRMFILLQLYKINACR
jgi:hypothetical protein